MSEKITKRPLSAFMFFMKDYRENYKGNTSSIGEVAKSASIKWKSISDSQRKVFQDLADKDKKRYEGDLAAGMVTNSKKNSKATNQRVAARKVKDPNAPKKTKTAYMCYLAEYRKSSTLTGPKLVSKAASMWKELTEKDKELYVKLSLQDKQRYINELENYKKSGSFAAAVAAAGKKTKPAATRSTKAAAAIGKNSTKASDDDAEEDDASTDFDDSADEVSEPNDLE